MAGRRFSLDKFPNLLKNPPPDVDIMLYDKKKKDYHPGGNTMKKSRMDQLEGRMDRFEGRMDRLEESIAKLTKTVENGFSELRQNVNSLKQDVKDINARLDYNCLKKLPVNSR